MGEFVPFDKDHEDEPAFPNCLPAGFAVGLAGEKAAQAGDATQEVPVGGEALCRLLKLGGEDPDRNVSMIMRQSLVQFKLGSSGSFWGGLIHTAVGLAGGTGGFLTKRWGLASKA